MKGLVLLSLEKNGCYKGNQYLKTNLKFKSIIPLITAVSVFIPTTFPFQ